MLGSVKTLSRSYTACNIPKITRDCVYSTSISNQRACRVDATVNNISISNSNSSLSSCNTLYNNTFKK